MAKAVKFVGPEEGREIAATGQWVGHGETVVVEDDELAKALLAQEGYWERSSADKAKEEGE